jgi:hypothetical protein
MSLDPRTVMLDRPRQVVPVGLHSFAMLAVAGVLAVVVYQKLGVEVLRRAWVNLDFIWVGALVVVDGLALGLGLWSVLVG